MVYEATYKSPCGKVCIFAVKNSRPLITQTPLFRTTEAHGQFLGRVFNPLAKLLLLRTLDPMIFPRCCASLLADGQRNTIWSRDFCLQKLPILPELEFNTKTI